MLSRNRSRVPYAIHRGKRHVSPLAHTSFSSPHSIPHPYALRSRRDTDAFANVHKTCLIRPEIVLTAFDRRSNVDIVYQYS